MVLVLHMLGMMTEQCRCRGVQGYQMVAEHCQQHCRKCNRPKPPLAHHCQICKRSAIAFVVCISLLLCIETQEQVRHMPSCIVAGDIPSAVKHKFASRADKDLNSHACLPFCTSICNVSEAKPTVDLLVQIAGSTCVCQMKHMLSVSLALLAICFVSAVVESFHTQSTLMTELLNPGVCLLQVRAACGPQLSLGETKDCMFSMSLVLLPLTSYQKTCSG